MGKEIVYVLAGSYSEYVDYCGGHGLCPKKGACRIANEDSLRGIKQGAEVVTYGTWRKKRDLHSINIQAQARNLKFKPGD